MFTCVGLYSTFTFFYLYVQMLVLLIERTDDEDMVRSSHACFNSMLEISCAGDNALLAFDSARYGRNNSLVATHCDVPFSWNCDVDVQFLLNRACAGRRRCSIDVGVDRFTDPCGYAEFLVVAYRCVPGLLVNQSINHIFNVT